MTLLAAFQILLHRYSGQDDFAIGSPAANRTRAEVEGLIGYFINMLVLRADLSGDPSFPALLGRVRTDALGAFEHQELPLERLVEALHPGRDLSRTPLFQVMFVFQNLEVPDVGRSDLTIAPLEVSEGTGTAKFDLTLAMADDGPEMVGSFEYDSDLFDGATIERMVGHFVALLEGVVSDPARRVSELPILPAEERERVVVEWNRTDLPRPAEARVHRLFEARARGRPTPRPSTACLTAGSTSRQTAWHTGYVARESALTFGWVWPSSGRPRWPSACWASSRRAGLTSPSTRLTPANAWPSCSTTPECPSCSPSAGFATGCPKPRPR
jgi:non-ribosomal peptide synthetase component F